MYEREGISIDEYKHLGCATGFTRLFISIKCPVILQTLIASCVLTISSGLWGERTAGSYSRQKKHFHWHSILDGPRSHCL